MSKICSIFDGLVLDKGMYVRYNKTKKEHMFAADNGRV